MGVRGVFRLRDPGVVVVDHLMFLLRGMYILQLDEMIATMSPLV